MKEIQYLKSFGKWTSFSLSFPTIPHFVATMVTKKVTILAGDP
jgi:hypothetical protein